jgi:hypothetical protein
LSSVYATLFFVLLSKKQNINMKLLLVLMSVCTFTFLSCSKPSQSTLEKNALSEKIVGKWKHTQSYYSIGGPLIYVSTENLGEWIEFKNNGRFASNMAAFKNVTKYEVVDSLKVKFITPGVQQGFRLFYFTLGASDNSLSLSPADFICIEGCGDKFKKGFF